MISIIINSFKEPNLIGKAIESILNNKVKEKYELIVAAPDEGTADVIKKYARKHRQIRYLKDEGKGKVNALNLILKIVKGNILILTDGDVYVSNNAIQEILNEFKDEKVGCVSGHPISTNDKNTMLGYFSHLLFDAGAHNIRKLRNNNNQFLECSGYLFAFRNNGIIKELPTDVAEDSITPYYFWKNNYKIKYVENALVYVKNPTSLKDFIKQRKRTIGSHAKLKKYAPDFPKVKSLFNEIRYGLIWALSYPKNIKEFIWTLLLFPIRLYTWIIYYTEHLFKKEYQDKWERIESTKT